MDNELIGTIAATLTTASFIPQVLAVIKTKDTEAISLLMYVMFLSGVAFWLLFGVQIESLSMIVANSITLMLGFVVLAYKLSDVLRSRRVQAGL